ncbi:MAG: hypothetical protein LBS75_03685 [Synergistaceae bacterium]|jgi:hypothetical protein|nr:hypothetical protein [Synergistaceae bacterium]
MNIRSVSGAGGVQEAHASSYIYGIERAYLPPKSPHSRDVFTRVGPGQMETVYQFRQVEGWLGDVPVSFTFLMAYRSYEYTKQVFSDWDRRTATSSVNSWLV